MSFSRTAFFSFMSRMIEPTSSGVDGERKKEIFNVCWRSSGL